MNPLHQALHARVVGDDHKAVILADSTTTVLKVADASTWLPSSVVYVTGAGASASNNWWVTAIAAVSLSANTITVSPALPAAPQAGDQVRNGCKNWLRYVSADQSGLSYRQNPGAVDAKRVTDDRADKRGVGHYSELTISGHQVCDLTEATFEVRYVALDEPFVQGFFDRLDKLLSGDGGALSGPGVDVFALVNGGAAATGRTDGLMEKKMVVDLTAVPREVGV